MGTLRHRRCAALGAVHVLLALLAIALSGCGTEDEPGGSGPGWGVETC